MSDGPLDKISYFAVYDNSILEALQWAIANGFSGVQVAVESPHLSYERVTELEKKAIRDLVKERNLRLILHAPDNAVSLLQTDSRLRQGLFRYYRALCEFADEAGALMITLHLGALTSFATATEPPERVPAADLQYYRKFLLRNLDKLVEINQRRLLLCVENCGLGRFTLDILQPYLDDGRLALCWDIAKMEAELKRQGRAVASFFRDNIQHVKQVHLHDLDAAGRSHLVIGHGVIEFERCLAEFDDAQVLDYCIEVRPRDKAKESLENLRRLLARGGGS
jgi:sugar phosphate isomerase/epimerase